MKSVEEIRKEHELNQTNFANQIGLAFRTYQKRLSGETDWLLRELIQISRFNNYHKWVIESDGKKFEIAIKECDGMPK